MLRKIVKVIISLLKKITIIDVISALLVGLWAYASIVKLRDYHSFRVQLGKSPLLVGFEHIVAIVVPTVELLIALAILNKAYRIIGFYASLFMLVMFTAYLIALLDFSFYTPCSCGGILGKLPWNVHIAFNLSFAVLAIAGIIIGSKKYKSASLQMA
jgi:hypothetical protein